MFFLILDMVFCDIVSTLLLKNFFVILVLLFLIQSLILLILFFLILFFFYIIISVVDIISDIICLGFVSSVLWTNESKIYEKLFGKITKADKRPTENCVLFILNVKLLSTTHQTIGFN